jgi:hypothetical protein
MTDSVARGAERRARWMQYLRAHYGEVGPDPPGIVAAALIADALGWSADDAYRVAQEIQDRGRLKFEETVPGYSLTTVGVDDIGSTRSCSRRTRWQAQRPDQGRGSVPNAGS